MSMTRRLLTVLMIVLFISSSYTLFFKRVIRRAIHRVTKPKPERPPYSVEEFFAQIAGRFLPRRSAFLDFGFHLVTFVISAAYLAWTALARPRSRGGRAPTAGELDDD